MLTPSLLLTALAAATVANSPPAPTPSGALAPVETVATHPATASPPAAPHQLVVLSYNIHGLPWPLTKGRKRAMKAIGEELAALRKAGRAPDIVLIQEGFDDIQALVAVSGYRYWAVGPDRRHRALGHRADMPGPRYLTSGEGWGKLAGAGLHVLSDLPISDTRRLAFRHCAGWDCLANKGVMMVHVDPPGVVGGLDVVNTHLNSRRAAKVPLARSLSAHNRQVDELTHFIGEARTPGAALLVGGDFNVKNAPERYYYKVETRPFTVVSEFCNMEQNVCEGTQPRASEPWLVSQDLQAFAATRSLEIRPMRIETLFADGASGGRLSDHDGLLVRYELTPR